SSWTKAPPLPGVMCWTLDATQSLPLYSMTLPARMELTGTFMGLPLVERMECGLVRGGRGEAGGGLLSKAAGGRNLRPKPPQSECQGRGPHQANSCRCRVTYRPPSAAGGLFSKLSQETRRDKTDDQENAERHNDEVIQMTDHRNEVRDEVDRAERI